MRPPVDMLAPLAHGASYPAFSFLAPPPPPPCPTGLQMLETWTSRRGPDPAVPVITAGANAVNCWCAMFQSGETKKLRKYALFGCDKCGVMGQLLLHYVTVNIFSILDHNFGFDTKTVFKRMYVKYFKSSQTYPPPKSTRFFYNSTTINMIK